MAVMDKRSSVINLLCFVLAFFLLHKVAIQKTIFLTKTMTENQGDVGGKILTNYNFL